MTDIVEIVDKLSNTAIKQITRVGEALEETRAENAKMRKLLTRIANITHHGSLIGFSDIYAAATEINELTVDYWDKEECARLQNGGGE